MKTHPHLRARGNTRVNNQQVIFELKHRVVLALNKLADRDTYQIGVEELDKTIECLTPDAVAPFLSCILDIDSEQKSAVRKECIRLMGTLATFHEGVIGPHLGKMVASIVKRLKDPDSVVREACVETVGVLASKLSNGEADNEGVFVALVKPLFEALGEQNKQVQSGSALCLARVIDNNNNPPVAILQRILARTNKLLKNPHFMAKPAVIELNKSIIQAGGAPTRSALSTAMASIQEALKSSDWMTRKVASASLGEIALRGGSFFGPFKTSCIHSLESCRFDKVKPVRDTVLQALHLWRGLSGADTPEPSETGSSIKENFYGYEFGDTFSANESAWRDVPNKKVAADSIKKRIPLSVRKGSPNYVENPQHSKANSWHVEIAVPKTQNFSFANVHNEESEGSSVTKTTEILSSVITSPQDAGYEYVPVNDRQECSSITHVSDNFETKFVTVSHDSLEEDGRMKPLGINQQFAAEEISSEEKRYSMKLQDRRSLDSTVTELSSKTVHSCCLQTTNEILSIRKQLLEIENKQSSLIDLLKIFTSSTMDSLSTIQSKVLSLEHTVDRIGQDLAHGGRFSDLSTAKLSKKSPSIASPRLSTCTPRPSLDVCSRQPSLLSMKNPEFWEEKTFSSSRSSSSARQGAGKWMESTTKPSINPIKRDTYKFSVQEINVDQRRKTEAMFTPALAVGTRQNSSDIKDSPRELVKGCLSEGDLESAYVEALYSAEELVLIELLDRTGPVLDSLSRKTATDVLSTLASYFLEQRFVDSIIPWLQQVVNLSNIHGPTYVLLSAKARREFLSSIQKAANLEFSNPAERRSVSQLAMKLQQIWGKCS